MKDFETPRNTLELIEFLNTNNIPNSQYKLYYNRFWEEKARRLNIPLRGVFELTPLCNLDCKMCYVHLSTTKFNNENLIPVDVWKSIMNHAHRAGMLKATLTGGECLTYPGFIELYLYLYGMGIRPSILSNGVLMDKDMTAFLIRYRPSAIQISLYGSSDDEYEKVTGHRLFKTVYENLILLKDSGLAVNITITPNQFMSKNLHGLFDVISSLNLPFTINARLLDPRPTTNRTYEDITDEEYVNYYKFSSKMNHRPIVEIDPAELPDENRDNYSAPNLGLKCGAGRSTFTIKYDGTMCPCVSLDNIISKPLEIGFMESWKKINELAKSYIMPAECNHCIYRSQCLLCPAMHKHAPKGHCDHRICNLTKKMVCAGVAPLPIST